MDIFEALYTTRAMRRMQDRDVPDELISRLLDAAIRAPSGGNFQNWGFVVIRDRAMKAYLGGLFREDVVSARRTRYRELDEAVARGERSERLDAHAAFIRSMLHLAERFESVPVFIAALIRSGENTIWPGGSIYPAVWSLQLAARAHGIGTRPGGQPRPPPERDLPPARRPGGRGVGAGDVRGARLSHRPLGRAAPQAGPRGHLRRAVGPAAVVDGPQAALAVTSAPPSEWRTPVRGR